MYLLLFQLDHDGLQTIAVRVIRQKGGKGFGRNNFTCLNIGDVVGTARKVCGDVGGEQDGCTLRRQLPENIRQLRPGYRVQAAGWFVQNQKFSPMGQGQCQLECDFHALGQLPDLFAGVQPEDFQIVGKGSVVPVRVKAPGQSGDLRQSFPGIKYRSAGGVTDMSADVTAGIVLSKDTDDTAVSVDKPQNRFHSRGLSSAISAKKTHDMAFLQRKANIFQRKIWILLTKPGNLQNGSHSHPSLWLYFRTGPRKSPPL